VRHLPQLRPDPSRSKLLPTAQHGRQNGHVVSRRRDGLTPSAEFPTRAELLAALIERIEHVAIIVLMPIFFALAGLNTTPDVFEGAGLGALTLILGVAIVGKIAGGAAGARIAGQPWRTSFAVGSLMNARGMMELIVIKVGLDIGVIGNSLFTMLMVMAIVTTFMTGPLLTLFGGGAGAQPEGDARYLPPR